MTDEEKDTLIKIIEKQQKEIEYWKKAFQREQERSAEMSTDLVQQDLMIRKKDKIIDLICECVFRRFTAHLVIEYGIENKEQFKEKFIQYYEKEAENGD